MIQARPASAKPVQVCYSNQNMVKVSMATKDSHSEGT